MSKTLSVAAVQFAMTEVDSFETFAAQVRAALDPHLLTVREIEVLTLLSGGLTNQEIAGRTQTSPRTVSTHVDHILGKLAVGTRAAAGAIATEEGLLKLPLIGGSRGFERLLIGVLDGSTSPSLGASGAPTRKRPLKIGLAIPLSGPAQEDGREMLNATRLAVGELNSRGGIAGRSLEYVVEGIDINSAASIDAAFRRLIDQGVDALGSGYLTHQNIAHDLAAEYSAPYLHAATLDFMVQRVAQDPITYQNVFQICPGDMAYGPGFLTFINWLNSTQQWRRPNKKLAVLRRSWKYGDLGIGEMMQLADIHGWDIAHYSDEIGADSGIDPKENWRREARRVAELDPAAVMVACYLVDETVAFVEAFRELNQTALIYCLYTPSVPEFRERLGPLAEGIIWATTTGTYSDSIGASFAHKYQQKFSRLPGRSHAGIAYDRVHLLAKAWAFASNPSDFSQVNRLLKSGNHRGVNGAYSFDTPGQSSLAYPFADPDPSLAQAHLVFQLQGGKQKIIWPELFADGTYKDQAMLMRSGAGPGEPQARS